MIKEGISSSSRAVDLDVVGVGHLLLLVDMLEKSQWLVDVVGIVNIELSILILLIRLMH